MLEGGHPATLDELGAVPLPPITATHHPIAHNLFVQLALDEIKSHGLTVTSSAYLLNKSGAQMVAVIRCDAIDADSAIAFALRSSHDKSMSKGLAGGRLVTVCSNGMFSGDAFVVMRKHTPHVWRDLERLVAESIGQTEVVQAKLTEQIAAFKRAEVTTPEGYEILGRAFGAKLLTSVQATTAFRQWREPTHEAFEPRDLWSLYNAGTEALKLGAVRGTIARHTRWHDHMVEGWPVQAPARTLAADPTPDADPEGILDAIDDADAHAEMYGPGKGRNHDPCPMCDGSGKGRNHDPCEACEGTGRHGR